MTTTSQLFNGAQFIEATDEVLALMQAIVDQNNEMDFSSLFENSDKVEVVAEVAPVHTKEQQAFIDLTISLYNVAKATFEKWTAKQYKKASGGCEVYDHGNDQIKNYSFNYINSRRRENAINDAASDMKIYAADLAKMGISIK